MKSSVLQPRLPADFMNEAYKEAKLAFAKGEVPVGAVIVNNGEIIARAHNLTEQLNDVTAHAEMMAITSAENHLANKYLSECDIYITLEPCIMCAGALFWAQFKGVIFAAPDPKQGFQRLAHPVLHPKTQLRTGLMQQECGELISRFFLEVRNKTK